MKECAIDMTSYKEFASTREEQNRLLLENADRTVKRIISADSSAYGAGALDCSTKELLGLVASLSLRCDDCISYHLGRCASHGIGTDKIMEAMGIACLVGGTITVPHLRRAVGTWLEILQGRSGVPLEPALPVIGPEDPGIGYDPEKRLQAVCDLLHESVPRFDWVGFYLVDPASEGILRLGPFAGKPTEHVRIAFGRGICGQAASAGTTITVDDVSLEPGYLSCSSSVRSEIVVPVFHQGRLAGELDIDSDTPAAFSAEDRKFLEHIAEVCSGAVAQAASMAPGGIDEKHV